MEEAPETSYIDADQAKAPISNDISRGTKLTTDYLDVTSKALSYGGAHVFPLALLMLSSEAAGIATGEPKLIDGAVLYTLTTVGYYGVRHGKEIGKALKKAVFGKKETVQNTNELGYELAQMVYQGKRSLTIGNETLQRGDNFIYIRLPNLFLSVKRTEDIQRLLTLWADLLQFSFQEIRGFSEGKDYKVICIEVPEQMTDNTSLGNKPQTERKNILSGKRLSLSQKETPSFVLTREEFEEMTETPDDLFRQACDALGDEAVNRYVSLAVHAQTNEERGNAIGLLEKRLDGYLTRELEIHFNGPEMSFTRSADVMYPGREKIYRSLQLKTLLNGERYVQLISANGNIQQILLKNLLRTQFTSLEETLHSTASVKNAQLAYYISQIIAEIPEEELILENRMKRDKLIKTLRGIGVLPFKHKPVYNVNLSGLSSHVFTDLKSKARPLLTSLVLFAASQGITHYGPNVSQGITSLVHPPNVEESFHKPDFTHGVPKHSLEWKIDSFAGADTSGYYTESTAHVMKSGKWEINKERAQYNEQLQFAHNFVISDTQQHIRLVKQFSLVPFDSSTKFKAPIKSGTQIGAILIQDVNGKIINFSAHLFKDGTLEIEVPHSFGASGTITATISLLPISSGGGQVHAPEPVKSVDTKKLNGKAQQTFVESIKNGYLTLDQIADAVKQNHEYSISPQGNALSQAKTPEETLNAIADSPVCDCDVCNTESVLISSIAEGDPEYLNIAFGYLQGVNNPSSARNGSYLLGEARHAYGVDQTGVIHDATALQISNDRQTHDYLQLLARDSAKSPDELNNEWNQKRSEQNQLGNELKLLGTLLGGTTGVVLARQGARYLKRVTNRRNLAAMADEAALAVLTKQDLIDAYNLFSEISWANPDEERKPHIGEKDHKNKKELLKAIRNNMRVDRLEKYVKNPKQLDETYPAIKRAKLEFLARYLI